MSLATRCTACTTVFRVVQDQLKVSEGWVRCGRCDTVFNALEQLFDLERDGLPADPATGLPTNHDSLPELASEATPKPPLADAFGALLRERAAATQQAEAVASEAAHAEPSVEHHELLQDIPGATPPDADPDPAAAADDLPPPEFVRHAERDARWQRPRVRWALRGAAVLLLAALALQVAHHFRDTLAARWPEAQSLLASWCDLAGCRIEALRRIADVTVENTGLTPAAAGPGSFQFSVTLRNRGRSPVALPSIDLTLTDSNGQLVARRALAPGELNAADVTAGRPAPSAASAASAASATTLLRPDTDTRLSATLATTGLVVGYTVEVFYP